jgi:predicted Rossmann-fold nucleotide-binding protein
VTTICLRVFRGTWPGMRRRELSAELSRNVVAPNPYTTPELTFRFHYFAMRKMHLAMRANALAIFPGGFGTMDELFEILTLRQTQKAPPIPIVLFDRTYWQRVINFEALAAEAMIDRNNLELFDYAESAEEVWQMLVRRGLRAHTPDGGSA